MKNKIVQILLATGSLCFAGIALADDKPKCGKEPEDCPCAKTVKLSVDTYALDLQDKRPICVSPGGTFNIEIKVKKSSGITLQEGDVTAIPKRGSTWEVSGSNKEDAQYLKIRLDSTNAPKDAEVKFDIDVKGVGMLDPKVRVVESNVMRSMQYFQIREAMNELGVELQDVNTLFADFDTEANSD